MAFIVDRGPSLGIDLIIRSSWTGFGMKGYIRGDFVQVEANVGMYAPIKLGTVAITPLLLAGLGLQVKDKEKKDKYDLDSRDTKDIGLGISFGGGMQFTMAAVPGLYFQGSYQYNLYLTDKSDPHVIYFGIGYGF
jgi:hypothetical protein